MATQSLSNIVDVTVTVSPAASINNVLNLGLIVGTSTIISDTDRVKVYGSTTDMKTGGWAGTEPEYLAAQLYFSQSPAPTQVAIGRWDTSASETAVQAVTACRNANSQWYSVYVCGAVDADIEAVAAYIETVTPISTFFYDTQDSAVSAGTAGNVMATLQTSKYKRTFGQFSTTTYAGVSAMGIAMGSSSNLPNSAFTLAYKNESGVTPEPLTTTEFNTITGYNGNVFTTYGSSYNLLVKGTMADGSHFDEVLNLDNLATNIQSAVMTALITGSKIPQTDSGVTALINAMVTPCDQAYRAGVLASGVWNGAPVLGLNTGDTLSNGYLILADTVANQSQADRDARKSPPIYVACKLAGAIEDVIIGVVVNQ